MSLSWCRSKGATSAWSPYIKILPTSSPLPVSLPPHLWKELQWPVAEGQLVGMRKEMEDAYAELARPQFGLEEFGAWTNSFFVFSGFVPSWLRFWLLFMLAAHYIQDYLSLLFVCPSMFPSCFAVWAVSVVHSRSFTLGGREFVLMPFMDMINHHHDNNVRICTIHALGDDTQTSE